MQSRSAKPFARFILRPWALGVVFAALLFSLLFILYGPRYLNGGDAVILRAFMGYGGGEPATFHLYTHTALAWLLYALAGLLPDIAWFSVVQLVLLYLACAVIIKSFAQIARHSLRARRGGALFGALFGLFFSVALALYSLLRITFPCTAALCGAAAVAQLFSVDFERGRGVVPRMLGGAALLLGGSLLRQSAVLPSLLFFALALLIKLLTGGRTRRAVRPALIGALCTALLLGLFAGIREGDILWSGEGAYIGWQRARSSAADSADLLRQAAPETLEKLGWTQSLTILAADGFALDDRITADALNALRAEAARRDPRPFSERLITAWRTSADLFAAQPRIAFAVLAALGAALAGVLAARRRDGLWAALGTVCALLGGAAILILQAWRGQSEADTALAALCPMCLYAAASALSFSSPLSALLRRRALAALTVLVFTGALAAGGYAAVLSLHAAADSDTEPDGTAAAEDLDEYALCHPEYLLIHDSSVENSRALFPDTAYGIPVNIVAWGGWDTHSPAWRRQLQGFGIHELNASIFLRGHVLYATRYHQPPAALLAYLREYAGAPVAWELLDTYGEVCFYSFSV